MRWWVVGIMMGGWLGGVGLACAAAPTSVRCLAEPRAHWIEAIVGQGSQVVKIDPWLSKRLAPDCWLERYRVEDLPALTFPAYFNELDKARAQAFHGRYKLALRTLRHVGKADAIEVALVRATALIALGRYAQAAQVCADPAVAGDPRVELAHASLLMDMGRYRDAIALLQRHLADHPDSVAGHERLGAAYERIGELDLARRTYAWFDAPPQRFMDKWMGRVEEPFTSAAALVSIGRAYDRWAALSGAYADNPRLHDAIFSMFVRAYDVVDRGHWPARVAAAEYLLSHDDQQAAMEELSKAYRSNPRDPRLLALLASARIDGYDFSAADAILHELRVVNEASVSARVLQARADLRRKRIDQAVREVNEALEDRPEDLTALGVLAACRVMALDEGEARRIFDRIDALDAGNATAWYEAGIALVSNHESERAVGYLRKAVERAPWWAAARNALGLALMQEGDEGGARIALEAAYRVDPFNVKSVNSLRVLDEMAKFSRLETAHFIFVFDDQEKDVVARYMAPMMERAYAELTAAFEYQPPWKTTVEVFPDKESFSVRTAGLPGLETYGTSMGRVMTIVAPRVGKTMGPYHFARVMRHELTHTINLAATEGRCPRWLTEGLAVEQEDVPYRFEWVPKVMYQRATTGKLFDMDALDEVLLHPGHPQDGEVAYMQGFWVARFLREKYGPQSIVKLLKAFKDGASLASAINRVTGQELEAFQREFFESCGERVSGWGYDAATSQAFDELMRRGDERIKSREFEGAIGDFEQALVLQPMNPLPHRRLAGLYLKLKRPGRVIDHLAAISFLELDDGRYARAIVRLALGTGDLARAKRFATEAIYIDPYDPKVHELMASVLGRQGDRDGELAERAMAERLGRGGKSMEKVEGE